jgi:dihydrofolate reductase
MRKLFLQVQTTIDGYMAGPNGEMDWVHMPWSADLNAFVAQLTSSTDTILLGKNLAMGFIPYWEGVAKDQSNPEQAAGIHFSETPKVVFSHTLNQSPWANATLATGDLKTEVDHLKTLEGKNIICYGGGQFVSSLLSAGLVDELFLFVNPSAIGSGMALFREPNLPQTFGLVHSQAFDCGIVLLHYQKNDA